MWNGSNVGFANGPLLNQGAIEAIELCGSEAQKHTYIPKLVSGEWCGTMDLTEPQAGSDLAAVRTKAIPDRRSLSDQRPKDFHHVRRARPGTEHHPPGARAAPQRAEGTKGISLFIVPKVLVNADGSLGERNDVFARESSTNSESTATRPARSITAKRAAQSGIWWANRIADSNICSS